jgi:Secretion system C-terminal sorting domain
MKRYNWHQAVLLALALFLSAAGMAQQQPIVGTPLKLGNGITKSVDEIINFSAEAERLNPVHSLPIQMGEELHIPTEQPGPGEENRRFSRSYPTGNAAARPNETAGVTQSIWSNFMGSDFSSAAGGWPPDNNGDVGTTQVLLIQNYRVKVYAKPSVTGTAVTTPNGTSTTLLASPVLDVSLNTFFRTAFAGVTTTDPHVRFDRLSGRWFVVAMTTNESTNNFLLFAVSSAATITPTSASAVGTSFTFFRTSISSFPGDAGRFLDYPTLGVDKNSLYVGANIFTNSSGGFSQTSGYVVNKADMIAGSLTITPFSAMGTATSGIGSDIRTPQGVHNDDPAATDGFFIGSSAFFSQLIIRRITYSGSTPTMQPQVVVSIATNRSPLKQVALGSSGTLDASNTRLFAAMIMKNKVTNTFSLWTSQNVGVVSDGTTSTATNDRNGSRWYEIRNYETASPTVTQFGTHFNDAATTPRGFWFPSIAMSGQGHAILATSSSSAVDRIDINIAGRYRTTPSGDLEDSLYATATGSDYSPLNGGNFVDRWGDYSQVVVDPLDNMTMWAFHQYTNTTNSYGVRAIQLKAPRPPSFTASSSTGIFCGTLVNVTLTGISSNNREFFDPGTDAGGPGFTRLTVSISGGVPTTVIPATNINFVSPTQVNFRMNTIAANAPAGTYVITVTNPDGQTGTTTFALADPCTIPVTLTEFTGRLVNEQSQLNWTTTSEYNSKEFVVEKSIDGQRFSPLATVAAKGNSNTPSNYQLLDKYPYPGNSYYRLKMVDRDASFTYSNVVRIVTAKKALAVIRLFPNPTKDKVSLELVAEKQQSVTISLSDFGGKRVYRKAILLNTGLNSADVQMSSLAAGTYFMEVRDEKGTVFYKSKLVKN